MSDRLEVNADDIGRFFDRLFRHADEGSYISLRCFFDDADGVDKIRAARLNGRPALTVREAVAIAEYAANHPQRRLVFAPPVATFDNAKGATERDVANGIALSVEADAHPAASRRLLEQLLGPATVVVASGGEWIDPETGEVERKLHLHWRLTEPTRTTEEHARLKRARFLAQRLAGAEATTIPLVHPMRWPGSWHRKGEPRLASILHEAPTAEVELDEALERLEEAAKARDLGGRQANGQEYGHDSDRTMSELVRRILTGEEYHGCLRDLAFRYLKAGMAGAQAVATLRGLMDASTGPRDARWSNRRDQIPTLVDTAAKKLDEQEQSPGTAGNAWPEPTALFAEHETPAPYPIDALPSIMRAAVETYQAFGQQPLELVACSALSAAALACQALADVDRDGNLTSPCSLSLITVAVSGERKTAADKRMRRALVDWQDEQRKKRAPAIKEAERRLSIWEARRDGMMAKIKRLSGSTKTEDEADRRGLEEELVRFDLERPKVPPTVRLFYEDVTPERLASGLAEGWRSQGGRRGMPAWTTVGLGLPCPIRRSRSVAAGVALKGDVPEVAAE